jgi:hypothetical protein
VVHAGTAAPAADTFLEAAVEVARRSVSRPAAKPTARATVSR